MPLDTVDRTPPPLFKQGPSALSKLLVLSALALLLMVVDARLRVAAPLRAALATAITPLQVLVLGPVHGVQGIGDHFRSLQAAQNDARAARTELARQAQRSAQVEFLNQENRNLRTLLGMRDHLTVKSQGAEILYDTADPYTRKVVINRGQTHGLEAGSPVMDGYGVLGQVTRVYPLVSEVTLLTDQDQAIPVLNVRTGQRSVAYGQPRQGLMELRFVPTAADVEVGDLLTTSGVDGIYPAGLPVAKVLRVVRQGEGSFAQILCSPMGHMDQALQVLVLEPSPSGLPDNSVKPVPQTRPSSTRPNRPGQGGNNKGAKR